MTDIYLHFLFAHYGLYARTMGWNKSLLLSRGLRVIFLAQQTRLYV
eukprot:COSAG05_NODE_520_length_9047_cov_2.500224_1_plen_46_part_00